VVELWWTSLSPSATSVSCRDAPAADVRAVLAAALALPLEAVRLDRVCRYCGHPTHGKPRLVGRDDVSFSAARRPGWMLLGLTRGTELGVDVDALDVRASADVYAVALTPAEQASVAPLDAFGVGRLWTRKEAMLKGQGLGLGGAVGPADIDVRSATAGPWHLRDVVAPPGHTAAVASLAPIESVRVVRPWWS
jgi:4'-phosphopantetheinyl transferase